LNLSTSIKKLNDWINSSEHIVFFGGAGVSTESGVPDFRSPKGIYEQEGGAERYLSFDFMRQEPERFYEFYRKYFMLSDIEPNAAHYGLAVMEKKGLLSAIITQNIDGLHQKAGSKKVLELHGNGLRFYCMTCANPYTFEDVKSTTGVFYCTQPDCGGFVRPDIVMYGESLDDAVINASLDAIKRADLLIVGGSSLMVYPAAGLIQFRPYGSELVLINLDVTPYDNVADLVIHEPIGSVFKQLRYAQRGVDAT
jgi:NAD-dependent deacetylase